MMHVDVGKRHFNYRDQLSEVYADHSYSAHRSEQAVQGDERPATRSSPAY